MLQVIADGDREEVQSKLHAPELQTQDGSACMLSLEKRWVYKHNVEKIVLRSDATPRTH